MSKALATRNVAAVLLGIGMILGMFGFAQPASANSSFFANGTSTPAAATTTVKSIGPGLATTTMYFDAYAQTFNGGVKQRPDFALLLIQKTSSSTASVLNIAFEFADDTSGVDCTATPAACDWYRNFTNLDVGATTSANLSNSLSYTFRGASSTIGGATSTTNRDAAALLVPTLTRYVRTIFTSTGATSTIWAKILPIQQAR